MLSDRSTGSRIFPELWPLELRLHGNWWQKEVSSHWDAGVGLHWDVEGHFVHWAIRAGKHMSCFNRKRSCSGNFAATLSCARRNFGLSDCNRSFFSSRSHRKFAFQCWGELCYFLQSALTKALAQESPHYTPIFGWNNPENVKDPSGCFFPLPPPKSCTQHICFFWDGVAGLLTLLNVHTSALRHGNILPQLWKRDFKKRTIVSSAFCSSREFIFTAVFRSDTYSRSGCV